MQSEDYNALTMSVMVFISIFIFEVVMQSRDYNAQTMSVMVFISILGCDAVLRL